MTILNFILRFSLIPVTGLSLLSTAATAREVTGIAAKVNGRVITKNEVNYHLTPYRQQLDASMPRKGPQYSALLKKAKDEILDSLIERELILSEFRVKTNGDGKIPAHLIDQEIDRQVRELYNNNRNEFNKSLRQAGVTPAQHRRETEKKLVVQAMRSQQFKNAVPPLPNEVAAEYNKHKIKLRDTTGDALEYHKIYIPKTDPQNALVTAETQLQLAEDIVGKLEKGANFEELAKQHSKDAWAAEGGKVEKTKRTDLSPAFAAILMETPIGKVLGPLEDGRGYTIVRLDKKHYGPAPSLNKVRPEIEARVRARKNKAKHDRWMKRLRDNAMIEKKM
ncbi:MAG: peptidylprolyl isomerase [Akkermansiaceae bacterium]|nr:peptidylprolyl isomerase [Akkermansiaceae bacterium]